MGPFVGFDSLFGHLGAGFVLLAAKGLPQSIPATALLTTS
jgi:hypothetical protein